MTPEQIRELIRAQLAQRATHEATLAAVRAEVGSGTADEAQETRRREAREAIVGIDATIDQHEASLRDAENEERAEQRAAGLRRELTPVGQRGQDRPAGGAHVGAEERTYTREKNMRGHDMVSFFQDVYAVQRGYNPRAVERLQRHDQEVRAEGELTARALGSGSVGGLVVPQYLVDLVAPVIRAGRPVANAMHHEELPDQGMSLIIPKATTGAAVASQATENTAVQNTDQVYSNITVPIVTIAGQQDLSRQLIERGTPGMDRLVYTDLAKAYHAEVDRQVITGSGAANQMLGILNTGSIAAATAYGAALSWVNFSSKLAGLIGAITGAGAGIAPSLIAMHPRRWAWLAAQVDGANRPLISPEAFGPMNAGGLNLAPGASGSDITDGDTALYRILGALQGLPVTTDPNIPSAVGTNAEDVVLVVDQDMGILWEDGDRMPRELRFEETKGNTLTVNLVVYGYAAFTAARYPQAFGKVGGLDATGGQGQIAPTF